MLHPSFNYLNEIKSSIHTSSPPSKLRVGVHDDDVLNGSSILGMGLECESREVSLALNKCDFKFLLL